MEIKPEGIAVLNTEERAVLRLGLIILGVKLGRYAPEVGQDETNDKGISLSDPVEMLRIRVDESNEPDGSLELRNGEIAVAWIAAEHVKNNEAPGSDTKSESFKRWSTATSLSAALADIIDFSIFRDTDEI